MRAIGNGIGIPFRRNTGQGVIWPSDLKSALVCWYSPRKQKLTEYDVIEAYVEDFTNWNYVKARGVATISQHKFIITECILKGLSIVEDIQEPYSNLTVRIIGITDNQEVLITDYVNGQHQIINTITEDGIYTIEDRHHFVGFGCNFVGTCNITIEQLPTSILKDLSGNGNHAYLYGGKGKLNSGMGLYKVDYTTYNNNGNQNVTDIKPNSFVLLAGALSRLGLPYSSIIGEYIPSYAIRIQGISGGTITYYYRNENGKQLTYVMDADGDYILPPCYSEGTEGTAVNIVSNNNINNVTITQIPDYPNQLCYDGKMYAVCYGFPILTDYTVMADRTWFEIGSNSCFASKRLVRDGFDNIAGAFAIEYRQKYCNNFGAATTISFEANKQEVIVQTKAKYMSTNINVGDGDDSDILIIGANNNRADAPREPYKGCHSDFLLFNRTLTQEEIDWVKNKIFQDTNN